MFNQRYRTIQFRKMSLDSDCKETKENVPLHREMGRLQLSFSLQQLIYVVLVS